MGAQAIGWVSSLVLVATIAKQIHKQWRDGASEGVSPWLFIGQMAASAGFALYSWMVGDWVFIATNSLMLINAVLGSVILLRNHRRKRGGSGSVKVVRNVDFAGAAGQPLKTVGFD